MSVRSVLVGIGAVIAVAWAFVVKIWRRDGSAGLRQEALDSLRRRYVFGAVDRQQFEEEAEKLSRARNRFFRRRSKRVA